MGKRFVIGDIHGAYGALVQVLELSKLDYDNDELIVLGDIVDGHPHVKECVDELLKIKNLKLITGNHDNWFINFYADGAKPNMWVVQGGYNTLKSYGYGGDADRLQYVPFMGDCEADLSSVTVPEEHKEFFNSGVPYIIEDNMVFVHGGFDPKLPIEKQSFSDLMWDRELIEKCRNGKKLKYDKVFVGHTTTQSYGGHTHPLKFGKLWMLDTGAGWNGKLTIMNIDTEEYFQSDIQAPCR